MDRLRNLIRQPLLHFLLAGALIFVAYGWKADTGAEAETERSIRVDREALLNFMQYRAQEFNRDAYAAQFDALSAEDREALVQSYVREEALYREAVSLGLDEGDYDIRQRMVQKISFLLEDVAAGKAEQTEPGDEELQAWYTEHEDDYRVEPRYTLAHIFFDNELHGEEGARDMAAELLASLGGMDVGFEEASRFGDRFRYLQTYVDRARTQLLINFGPDFVARVDELEPGDPAWHGPYASRLGWHLVLLAARSESRVPPLSEIRDRVRDDFRYDTFAEARARAESEIVDRYEVRMELP